MINRVLIRMKVVQMLYSYLLTRSEFRILTLPDNADADRRYAQKVYTDLLLTVLELSGYDTHSNNGKSSADNTNKYLSSSRLARSLYHNPDIRSLMVRNDTRAKVDPEILTSLLNQITTSAAYRSYIRKAEREIPEDASFWAITLNTVIAQSPQLQECFRKDDGFTNRGFRQGIEMAVETLQNYGDTRLLLRDANSQLEHSLNKAYDLYHALLELPVAITRMQQQRLEAARNKYLPSAADLNPNLKFVDNLFVKAIAENPDLEAYRKDFPFSWEADEPMIRSMLDSITQSQPYAEYMADTTPNNMKADAELWRQIMKTIILESDDLAEALEGRSVYWNDDLEIMGTFALKTIKRFESTGSDQVSLLPKYKDDEDARFGAELFGIAVKNYDTYREYIDTFLNTQTWEMDRIAFMDIVIMTAAMAEIINFPAIPIPVSLNEYIEIANSYSTPRSGQFINGILFSIINHLQEQGLVEKEFDNSRSTVNKKR